MQFVRKRMDIACNQTYFSRINCRLNRMIGAAMRGRYSKDGKLEQKLELNNKEISNTVTTVQKDCLVAEITIT